MKAEVVVIFTPLVNISSTEGCERQVSSSDNDSFTSLEASAPDQEAGHGDNGNPLAVEQGEQGQDDRGTLGGPSSDRATPDRDDSGPWSTCLGLGPTLGQFTERERRLGRW